MADNLYLTLIKKFDGDVFFPHWETTFPKVSFQK